ncbi:MAG TPA: hypothetical protein RMH99_11610 [Sandaracinaceae bacterium LLY-WYZ-13_1]|nr:hypothetical protein [Sandaracinaceae bacterium LLY-WYZ-13_1]
MDEPIAIDGSEGPLVVRRVVVWRRLEPGDVRTPGTEIAPESPHLEAKVVPVGIAEDLLADMTRLWDKRDEVTEVAHGWSARYEPAGILFALGGGLLVGTWLDYLPETVTLFAASVALLGVAIGVYTRVQKGRLEAHAERRWHDTEERLELERLEKRMARRWERFVERLREEGFRTDVRVGDVHEADRLVSVDVSRLTHPETWRADGREDEVRYGWVYGDGRVVEQVAELEDSDVPHRPDEDEDAGAVRDGADDDEDDGAVGVRAEVADAPDADEADADATDAEAEQAEGGAPKKRRTAGR